MPFKYRNRMTFNRSHFFFLQSHWQQRATKLFNCHKKSLEKTIAFNSYFSSLHRNFGMCSVIPFIQCEHTGIHLQLKSLIMKKQSIPYRIYKSSFPFCHLYTCSQVFPFNSIKLFRLPSTFYSSLLFSPCHSRLRLLNF